METNSRKPKVICTPINYKRFAEKFKEENRGQGPYVAALGLDAPYSPTPPGMHDYTVAYDYGYDQDDTRYDPNKFRTEKIFRYVEEIREVYTVDVPDPSKDAGYNF
jgi:hypothetical protein